MRARQIACGLCFVLLTASCLAAAAPDSVQLTPDMRDPKWALRPTDASATRTVPDGNNIPFYFWVGKMWCMCGDVLYLWLDGKYQGFVEEPGYYFIRYVRKCRYHRAYARSDCNWQWAYRKYYVKCDWSYTYFYVTCRFGESTWPNQVVGNHAGGSRRLPLRRHLQ